MVDMTEWGIELWDQFDNIDKHLQYGIEFAEKYAKFVKERSVIEADYAAKLKKLVKNYQPKKKEEDRSMFSTNKAFAIQLSELHDIAGQHEVIAEEMMNNINKTLLSFCVELKNDKKKVYQEGRHNQSSLDHQEKLLEQVKKKFEKEWKECERAQAYFDKLDNDLNVTKIDVEKARQQWNTRKDAVEACKTDYAATLNNFNKYQSDHYNTVMPKLFTFIEVAYDAALHIYNAKREIPILKAYKNADERRILKSRELMMEYVEIETKVKPLVQKCLEEMDKSAGAIDPNLDAQLVVDKLKSGFLFPSDKEFEDCTQPHQPSNESGETLPVNSINSNRPSNKKGGFGRLFGNRKQAKDRGEMPASGSQPKSPSPERKQKNNELPQTTPDENNEAKHEDDMALRKSRTLSAPPTRNLTLSVEKNVKLSSDQRCSSMEAVTMDDNPSEVTQRKNTKAKSQFRMSIPVNKKRLKAMFKSNKEEHVPKIEVSGPITCDIMGSAANDDYMVPISKSPKNDEHSEHPYDQVAVDRNHCVKNGDKEREGTVESPDYSHLPPEQRKKKLQKLIDELKKDIAKEEEGRRAIWKMQDAYRKNPALGDPDSLVAQLATFTMHLDKLQAELNQLETWFADASGSVKIAPDRTKSNSQRSKASPSHSNKVAKHEQNFGDDFDEEPEPIGSCVAIYDFEATSEGALSMKVGDKFSVIEADNGDGWTRAMNGDIDGYVPTSYIEIEFYT